MEITFPFWKLYFNSAQSQVYGVVQNTEKNEVDEKNKNGIYFYFLLRRKEF
jgi:hypothetical protein